MKTGRDELPTPDCPKPQHAIARRRALVRIASFGAAVPIIARADAPKPSVSATLLDGKSFTLDDVRGKPLLINFWATWCGPCRAEMPEIEAYYRARQSQGLEVIALSVDELAVEAEVRQAAQPYTFRVAMLKQSRISGFGRIWRMPVSAVIDRDGRLVKQDWFIEPKLTAEALDAVIKPLL